MWTGFVSCVGFWGFWDTLLPHGPPFPFCPLLPPTWHALCSLPSFSTPPFLQLPYPNSFLLPTTIHQRNPPTENRDQLIQVSNQNIIASEPHNHERVSTITIRNNTCMPSIRTQQQFQQKLFVFEKSVDCMNCFDRIIFNVRWYIIKFIFIREF